MRILLSFLLVLALAAPAWAVPLAWNFTSSDGRAVGSFAYDTGATSTGVHSLGGSLYTLSSWTFQLTGSSTSLPSTTFANDLAGQTGQLCVGRCTFSSGPELRLNFTNDPAHLLSHFSFALTEPVTTPPTAAQIGAFSHGRYEFNHDGTRVVRFFNTGALTQTSVPEPASWLLLLLGLALALAANFQRAGNLIKGGPHGTHR